MDRYLIYVHCKFLNDNLQSPVHIFLLHQSRVIQATDFHQDKRSGRVSAVKVQAAQFGREQAWHCFWWAKNRIPGGASLR